MTGRERLSLAVPLGLGMFYVASSFALGGLGAIVTVLAGRANGGVASPPLALVLLVAGLGVALGVALQGLWGPARLIVPVLAALGLAGSVARATGGRTAGLALPSGLSLVALALLLPPVRAWFSPERRQEALAVPRRAYVAAIAWAAMLIVASNAVLPAFHRLFQETGLRLSALTEAVLACHSVCEDYGYLVPALVVLGASPLLGRDERRLAIAAHAIGATLFVLVVLGVFLPIVDLLSKL